MYVLNKCNIISEMRRLAILMPFSHFLSLCDGCDPQTEFHRTDPYSGSGLASCPQWQGHGWHCTDWLWQNTFCKLLHV